MSKQDRQGARTPAQLEQKYLFDKTFAEAFDLVEEAKQTAGEAVKKTESLDQKLNQEEIFNRLTDNGTVKGLFMKDGQLYINASYLVTGVLRSADGKTFYLDLDKGVLKGQFEELTIAGKTVKELAKDTLEEQTQEEAFNKLTEGGKLEGLFMKEGQLYINASYLVTGILRSADGTTFYLDLDNGILKGSFQEFTVAGKSVEQIAGEKADAAGQAAKEAAAENTKEEVNGLDKKLNQSEVFNRLTDNGTIKGLFMKDGQLYINADFLATGVIKSADGTVQLDLANNTVTINGTRDGYKTQTVLSASGISAYGESTTGVMEHVLEFSFGVGGKPTAIMNNAWEESVGMAIAAAAGVFSLGTTEACTQIFGSDIDITPIGDLKIMGKTAYWKENSDGTFSLAGR